MKYSCTIIVTNYRFFVKIFIEMKKIYPLLMAAALVLSMTACGDKENGNTDTNSGATDSTLKAGRIGVGSINIAGYNETDVYGADFDNDGVLEFKISGEYISYNWTEGGNNIVNKADQWDYIEPLGTEMVIGPDSHFDGLGDAMFEETATLPALFFVGCRIKLADGIHYGWIKVRPVDGGLEWSECVYRTTPEATITTGKN